MLTNTELLDLFSDFLVTLAGFLLLSFYPFLGDFVPICTPPPPSLNPRGKPFPPLPTGSSYTFPHPRQSRGVPSNRGVPLPIPFPFPNPLPWGSLSFPFPLPFLPSHLQPEFVEVLERFLGDLAIFRHF